MSAMDQIIFLPWGIHQLPSVDDLNNSVRRAKDIARW